MAGATEWAGLGEQAVPGFGDVVSVSRRRKQRRYALVFHHGLRAAKSVSSSGFVSRETLAETVESRPVLDCSLQDPSTGAYIGRAPSLPIDTDDIIAGEVKSVDAASCPVEAYDSSGASRFGRKEEKKNGRKEEGKKEGGKVGRKTGRVYTLVPVRRRIF